MAQYAVPSHLDLWFDRLQKVEGIRMKFKKLCFTLFLSQSIVCASLYSSLSPICSGFSLQRLSYRHALCVRALYILREYLMHARRCKRLLRAAITKELIIGICARFVLFPFPPAVYLFSYCINFSLPFPTSPTA